MRTKLFFISFLLTISAITYAQESKEPGYKTPFKAGKFGDNWFIQLGAGAQTAFADKNHKGPDIQDRLTLAPTFAFGKWFNPFSGFRIKGDGGSLHGFQNGSQIMIHDRYYAAHLDFMWNMTSYYRSYDPKRVFGFIPYLGLGYIHREYNDQFDRGSVAVPAFNSTTDFRSAYNGLTANGGIMMTFRLGPHVDFHLDFGAILGADGVNGIVDDCPYDLIASATGGFTFKLGKSYFEVERLDYRLIDELNDRINRLRAENGDLSKRPIRCPECPEVKPAPPATTVTNLVTAPVAVNFRINSSVVDESQKASLYDVAELVKREGKKVSVIGYADKNTGSAALNLKLSEKRAKAVADQLIKYGVPSNSVIVEWKGAEEQPYSENNWNRVVVVSVEE